MRREYIDPKGYDLKAINPNRKAEEDTRAVVELLELVETHGNQVWKALADLRV